MKNSLVTAVLKRNLQSKAPESTHAITDIIEYLVEFQPAVAELLAAACMGVCPDPCDYQRGQILYINPKLFSQRATESSILCKVETIDKYSKALTLSGSYTYQTNAHKTEEEPVYANKAIYSSANYSFERVEANIVMTIV